MVECSTRSFTGHVSNILGPICTDAKIGLATLNIKLIYRRAYIYRRNLSYNAITEVY